MAPKRFVRRLQQKSEKLEKERHERFLHIKASHGLKSAASAAGISVRSAYRWVKSPPKKRGRKVYGFEEASRKTQERLSEIADRRIVEGHEVHVPFPSYISVTKQYNTEYQGNLERRQVSYLLSLVGYRPIVRPKHPALDKTDIRKAFAKKWKGVSPRKVVFSDEHFVSTNASTTHKMIVRKGERPVPKSSKRRQNIPHFQIWAAIGHNYKSPLVIFPIRNAKPKADADDDAPSNFRLNAKGYTRRCLPKVKEHLKKPGMVFMQDGARCHWAKSVKAYFAREGITVMSDFPASSPDLNPIESVWAELNRRISARRPQTVADLRAATISAWDEIPLSHINNYVARFQGDCARVYRDGGI